MLDVDGQDALIMSKITYLHTWSPTLPARKMFFTDTWYNLSPFPLFRFKSIVYFFDCMCMSCLSYQNYDKIITLRSLWNHHLFIVPS